MRIVIVGLGDLGQQLADILSRWENNELVLIDSDQKTCDRLAAELDALVLCGDGTDPEILRKARLAEANALVATTGSDPLNTVIAMLGRRIGVEKIVVKLNNVSLHSACQEIGVDKIIAPKVSAAAEIASVLHGLDKLDFSAAVRGGLRLVEFSAGQAKDKQLSALDLPEGSLIVSVLQNGQMILPRP
ncbi:MAG: TrkA family potassium uptake protein [Deltaproteobacteria bacterium]